VCFRVSPWLERFQAFARTLPNGAPELGNLYIKEAGQRRKVRAIPHGVLCFDVAPLNDRLYARVPVPASRTETLGELDEQGQLDELVAGLTCWPGSPGCRVRAGVVRGRAAVRDSGRAADSGTMAKTEPMSGESRVGRFAISLRVDQMSPSGWSMKAPSQGRARPARRAD